MEIIISEEEKLCYVVYWMDEQSGYLLLVATAAGFCLLAIFSFARSTKFFTASSTNPIMCVTFSVSNAEDWSPCSNTSSQSFNNCARAWYT